MQTGKNYSWTKWVYVCVALFLMISLVGCNPSDGSSAPVENEDPVSEGEDVVITFSYDEYSYSMFRPLIEAFHEENPSITVQYVPLSTEDYNVR
jgi:ABC-type glycerol-3-phosphate transport system substrate-binding protein